MAYEITPSIDGTKLATMDVNSVRKLWDKGIFFYDQTEDFFSELIGGPSSFIWERRDTSVGRGQKITFSVGSGFYDEPHIGEQVFETADEYEEFLMSSHELVVDWARHGVRFSERTEELMGMRNEIVSGFNTQQGAWVGRLKSEQLFMMYRELLPADNVVYANGKSFDTLVAADTLDWDEIIGLGVQMKRLGGQPAKVGKMANGQPVFRQGVIATTDSLFSLDLDSNYKQILRETVNQKYASMIFDGGYAAPKGHIIMEYTPKDHDGEGAIGSPLNPKAKLGVAITAGTTVFDVKGGGNATSAAKTKKKYFKYFRNYGYKFLGNTDPTSSGVTTLAQDAATHYFLIINPPNAATDPNKIGMYSYTTGNNGNQITIVNRLGSAASGARVTTLGDVTWNGGVWSGKHTDVHPVGALILPCNAKGQVWADSLMLGAASAYRGYGKYRNTRTQDEKEGGHIMERYVTTVFGQALRKDRQGNVPAAMRVRHAITYAGVPLPAVV